MKPVERFWVGDQSACVQLEEQRAEAEGVMQQQAAMNRALASQISDIKAVNVDLCLEVCSPVLALPTQLLSCAMFWIFKCRSF
jgi:hypothetical protein